jgi:hypothetical protein
MSKKTIASGNDSISTPKKSRDVKSYKQHATCSNLHGVKDMFQYPAIGYAESSECEIHALRKKYGDKYWVSMPNMMFFPLTADEEHCLEAQIPQYPVSEAYNLTDNVNALPKVFQGTLVLSVTPMAKPNFHLDEAFGALAGRMVNANPDIIESKRAIRQAVREGKRLVSKIKEQTRGQLQAMSLANTSEILYHHKTFDSPYQQYEQLKIFFKNKIPICFASSFEDYTDMMIEKMQVVRDSVNQGKIEVHITLREVKFAIKAQKMALQSASVKASKGITKLASLIPALPSKDGANLPAMPNFSLPTMPNLPNIRGISLPSMPNINLSGTGSRMPPMPNLSGLKGRLPSAPNLPSMENIRSTAQNFVGGYLEKAGAFAQSNFDFRETIPNISLNFDDVKNAVTSRINPQELLNFADLARQNLPAVNGVIDRWREYLAIAQKRGLPMQLSDLWESVQIREMYEKIGVIISENDLLNGGFRRL